METPGTPRTSDRPTPDPVRSAADLERAAALGRDAQRAARWYVRYLLAYAVASFVMCALFGVLGGAVATWVSTPLWAVFLTLLTVWSSRQRATLRGFARLHGTTILAWAVLWGLVVVLGERFFPTSPWWWFAGGLALTVPPLAAAARVHARTRA